MILLKDIKLFVRDKYAVLSLIFIAIFQIAIIFYSQSDALKRVFLYSVDSIYFFFSKMLVIIFTLIFLSNYLQVVYQYSHEKENFLLARSMPSGIKNFIKSKVLLANIISIFATQPFYWGIVWMSEFNKNIEMRFIYFCSFSLLFITLSITTFSSYYVLNKSSYYNNFILGVKSLLVLTFITMVSLITSAVIIILPIEFIYANSNFRRFGSNIIYEHSNIIFISILIFFYFLWLYSRHLLNIAHKKIESSEV
ncbi:MAG: hypothetical protein KAS62_02280 [Candidatus Delongbacteria bacterium]|nr:hypothetical protein [Candidatus Delongbacteria bacterium]